MLKIHSVQHENAIMVHVTSFREWDFQIIKKLIWDKCAIFFSRFLFRNEATNPFISFLLRNKATAFSITCLLSGATMAFITAAFFSDEASAMFLSIVFVSHGANAGRIQRVCL